MSNYYSFTSHNEEYKDKLRKYLHEKSIYYELSSCYNGWHFEIKIPDHLVDEVNTFITNM